MKQFAVGDHIFCWCSYLGVPFAFQHHAIVVATQTTNGNDDDDGEGSSSIVIMNFDHHEEYEDGKDVKEGEEHDGVSGVSEKSQDEPATKNDNDQQETNSPQQAQQQPSDTKYTPEKCCSMTLQTISVDEAAQCKWEHVEYNQEWHQRLWSRAGTCSSAQPDPVPIVMCRLSFLKQNQQELLGILPYHHHKRNGECIAVWCKMGEYTSFQGAAKMGEAGCHVGSFSLVGGIAAQVAASVVVPPLLPFMAAYDVGHTVVSFRELHASKTEWNEQSMLWNELFHNYMLENYDDKKNSQQPATTSRP